ncbi:MAG: isoamylase early set domain-containing protein [Anaeromyxobacter sp.]
MTDRELQALLDTRASTEATQRAIDALPAGERTQARRLVALARLSASSGPRPTPPPDFVQRTMARTRTRPAPGRTLASWLLAPRISPLGAAAGVAAAALLTFAALQLAGSGSGGEPAPAAVAAAPALETTPVALTTGPGERIIRLRVDAPGARTVQLAGDFNGWRPEATPLRRTGASTWSVDVPLTAGRRYQYMFVVDGRWVTDPAAPAHVDDGFGNRNAILDI